MVQSDPREAGCADRFARQHQGIPFDPAVEDHVGVRHFQIHFQKKLYHRRTNLLFGLLPNLGDEPCENSRIICR